MIQIDDNPTYSFPCKFTRPIDGGKFEEVKFHIVFNRLDQDGINDLFDQYNVLHVEPVVEESNQARTVKTAKAKREDAKKRNLALMKQIVAGFGEDVLDNKKQPLVFNQKNLEALLNVHRVSGAIYEAFFASVTGAAAKN